MKKRQRRSSEEWHTQLKVQREGQLSVADFCHQKSLDSKSFNKRKRAFEVQGMKSPQNRFVKMEPALSSSRASDVSLVLRQQNSRLVLHTDVDASWVAELMKVFVDVDEIYLQHDAVDFRKSINGLVLIVEQEMKPRCFTGIGRGFVYGINV
jgi:hypothetical protein